MGRVIFSLIGLLGAVVRVCDTGKIIIFSVAIERWEEEEHRVQCG